MISEIFLCFKFQLPAFWFTGEFVLLSCHKLDVLLLRRSFTALFPCFSGQKASEVPKMKESLGRMSFIFPTFSSIFRSYCIVLRGHPASLRGLLSPLISCPHSLVYYSHTLIEFPWERIGVVYKLALLQELLNLSAQPT